MTGATGPAGATGAAGPAGAQGGAGTPGQDGQLRIFGNGSAGAKVIAANATLADANLQYSDFTINTGVTLTVESGTVIRCTGTFTNNGTLTVTPGAPSGLANDPQFDSTIMRVEPNKGIAARNAMAGWRGTPSSAQSINGGAGGLGLTAMQARSLVLPGLWGGGGGAAGLFLAGASTGGGSLVVMAKTAVVNAGPITANAQVVNAGNSLGGGGGGGGVVVLASLSSVSNTSTISAKGAPGQMENAFCRGLPGGGGGGGIVHLLAPSVTGGTADVTAGAGASGGCYSSGEATAGGGGGASGGNGGAGGGLTSGGVRLAAQDGQPGHFLQTLVDPSALF